MENEAKDAAAPTAAAVVPINRHVLWRQVLGLVVWVGAVPFVCGGPLASILGFLLGGLTFADAWRSGIYKLPDKRSFANISPMGWGVAMALLLVLAYPTYLINRNRLRTIAGTNFFYRAVIVLGGLILAFCVLGTIARFAILHA